MNHRDRKQQILDEAFLQFEFSFCKEHDCKMNICQPCLKKLANLMLYVSNEGENNE